MKLLIAAVVFFTLIVFGAGWLCGTSYVYAAQDEDLSRCREITHDLNLAKDQVRLSDGRWCSL